MKSWRDALSPLWPEKQRVQDLPDPGGAGGGTDVQLAGTADVMGREFATDTAPYVPPLPVPLASPVERPAGQRGESSEVWLVNPPATLPGTGVLVAGGSAEKGSQFAINSIRIDNLTSQWMYFPELGAWVPPFWFGRVMRYDGSRVQRVKFETPGGITALPAATTLVARVVFSEEYWDEQSGASVASNLAPTTGGAPNAGVTIFDDLSGLPAEVQTTADAIANQAGLITDSLTFAYNGATWDRLRTASVTGASTIAGNIGILGTAALLWNSTPSSYTPWYVAQPLADGDNGARTGAVVPWIWNGASYDRPRVPNVFKQVATPAIGAGSTVTVWTPAAGKKPRLMGWVLGGSSGLVDAAVTLFETSTTGTFMGEVGFLAGLAAPSYVSYGAGGPIVSTSSAVIVAFSSTGLILRGTLFGTEE